MGFTLKNYKLLNFKKMERIKTDQGHIVFKPNVKCYKKPLIVEEFKNDEGEINYILENGNTILKDKYDLFWNPIKGDIKWGYKGENPDKTKIV